MNIVEKLNQIEGLRYLGVTEKDKIKHAENELGLSFADEYIQYVSSFGIVSFGLHELTGICKSKRLNVVYVTQKNKSRNEFVGDNFYVVEEANIHGIVIWQDFFGKIYQTVGNSVPEKIADSIIEYIEQ